VTKKNEAQNTSKATGTLIEFHSERGRIGKTTASNRVRDGYEDRGARVFVVRIESQNGAPAARPGDIRIYTEDLADSQNQIGGGAAVAAPLWEVMKTVARDGGAVIIDWPAGSTKARLELLASTSLAAKATAMGLRCISVAVTTTDATVLRQCARSLEDTLEVAPEMERVVIVNEFSGGPIARIPPSSEQGQAWNELITASRGLPMVQFPLIRNRGWELFESRRIEMRQVLRTSAEDLATKLETDPFIVEACRTAVAAWWSKTESELTKVGTFR
jgi:hypothetical protein